MQAFGQFQLMQRSGIRTWLHAPAECRSAATLAAVRRRLVACDGILAVAVNPDTGSVVITHSPAFSWSSIGAAAWRPADSDAALPETAPAPATAAAARPIGPAQHQPLGAMVEELVALALESVIARRPAAQIVQDVALGFLAIALRESRRA